MSDVLPWRLEGRNKTVQKQQFLLAGIAGSFAILAACGAQPGGANLANSGSNANANSTNAVASNTTNNNTGTTTSVETREPDAYQATVTLRAEATGDQQKTQLPALVAKVSRSTTDRRMEFTLPAGGRVIFLDKNGTNYVIMPETNQYAVLDKESLGFDVRRMLMPEQIVSQVKAVPGMQLVGDEKYNGRDAVKYRYAAVANTQSKAGDVSTESFMLVDKATGLPLHTETVSQSQSGANVQGYNGLRIITEITDITMDPAADQFAEPGAGMKKIDSEQVKAQVNMIFNSAAMLFGQALKQGQAAVNTATPMR